MKRTGRRTTKTRTAAYSQLSRRDQKLLDQAAVPRYRETLAQRLLRLRTQLAAYENMRVIINLYGGIVQDACIDGPGLGDLVIVDWDVDGKEKDHLQVGADWCWVYTTLCAGYDPQNLTQVAQAADQYRQRQRYDRSHGNTQGPAEL